MEGELFVVAWQVLLESLTPVTTSLNKPRSTLTLVASDAAANPASCQLRGESAWPPYAMGRGRRNEQQEEHLTRKI